MFKLLLIAILLVACNAQDKLCSGLLSAPVEPLKEKLEDGGELRLTDAQDLYTASSSKSYTASSSKSEDLRKAKEELSDATGNIIGPIVPWLPCPALSSSINGPQQLCPYQKYTVTSFWSSNGNGFCYVMFPYWKPLHATRCLCKECRNGCPNKPYSSPYFRNYCKPRSNAIAYRWAWCRGTKWPYYWFPSRERVMYQNNGCECFAYKTCF